MEESLFWRSSNTHWMNMDLRAIVAIYICRKKTVRWNVTTMANQLCIWCIDLWVRGPDAVLGLNNHHGDKPYRWYQGLGDNLTDCTQAFASYSSSHSSDAVEIQSPLQQLIELKKRKMQSIVSCITTSESSCRDQQKSANALMKQQSRLILLQLDKGSPPKVLGCVSITMIEQTIVK